MEEDPEDLTSLHYQIMFPPREPCHRQREYELEQHLALMDEPATARPEASMDMGDLGNLTIEHLSGYDDVSEAQKFLLVDDERCPKEDVLEIGIEASDLGSLLQQFEQKEAALTIADPSEVGKPQKTSSATKKISGPKNPSKKIVPVKRKSTILMEPIAMPSKRLRDKVPDERMSVSLPGSRTSSPLTVQPQGLSVICSADQGFDYLIMDHDYCNVQDTKLASQEPSGPANKAGQLAAEKRKALYKQKYKIRKKGKIKGRVVGGHYSEKALAEGVVGETDKPAFINKLPDYIHPMPEVSTVNSVKNAEGKNLKQGVVVPMPQPQPEKEALPKGKKPEFFDKIPDYFIGKHMYQEISKVKEAEEAEKQALEEKMTKLKEKPVETDSLHKKSKLEPSKDNEGAAMHPEAHRHKSRHHHHHHKVHIQGQVRNSIIKDRDAAINNGGELIDANQVNCQQPQDNQTEQTSNQQSSSGKQIMTNEGTKDVHITKSRKGSYSERLSRSRSRSRSYSSYSSWSSRSSARSRSYSSSSSDSSYSQSRRRGPSYISRSRSRSYSRSRSRSRSRSYRRRRRRYSTYSSASHSSSSISRSRSRSHSRSRHWRPRSHSRSFSRSRSRSRSRSHSRDSCMRRRRRSSRRESRQRTRSRSERRHRRSASIEQIEERREQRIEEQLEQWKDRRVVYIGRIPYGTTRTVIRRRFEKFGEIERITLHFRDEGDNYAFVTYNYKCDAYAAVEGANKDPEEPVYDICFGGRRQFCKSNYEDLDSMAQEEEAFDYGYKPSSSSTSGKVETDFDRLLQEAMRKVKR